MAIGSSFALSVPTVGTTVYTLNKASDGKYQDITSLTNSNGDAIPIVVDLRASSIAGSFRAFSLVLRHKPSMYDGVLGASQGAVTVSVNVAAKIGEDISITDIQTFFQYMGSVLAHSSVINVLRDGTYE